MPRHVVRRWGRRVGYLGAVLSFVSVQSIPTLMAARPAVVPEMGSGGPGGPLDRAGATLIDQQAFWQQAFGVNLVLGEGGLVLEPSEHDSVWVVYAGTTSDQENLLARTTYVEIDRLAIPIPVEPPATAVYLTTGTVEMLDGTWLPVTMLMLNGHDESEEVEDRFVVAPLASYRTEGDALNAVETWRALFAFMQAPARSAAPDPPTAAASCAQEWAWCRDQCRDRWQPHIFNCYLSLSSCGQLCQAVTILCWLFGAAVFGGICYWVCLGACLTVGVACVVAAASGLNRCLEWCDLQRMRCDPSWQPDLPI